MDRTDANWDTASRAEPGSPIERALAERAGLAGQGIHVRVAGDAVILSGCVPTAQDWQAVVDAVRELHGTARIYNQVRIHR